MPSVEFPPAVPFTCQVTAVLVEIVVTGRGSGALRFTVAVNSDCVLRGTVALVGKVTDVMVAVLLLLLPQDEMPNTTPARTARPKRLRSPVRINGSRSRQFLPRRCYRPANPAQKTRPDRFEPQLMFPAGVPLCIRSLSSWIANLPVF